MIIAEDLPCCSLKLEFEPNKDMTESDQIKMTTQKSILKKGKGFNRRRKKKRVLVGRVEKRRTFERRKTAKKTPKRTRKRIVSSNSSISGVSFRSESSVSACEYCGHRCCKQKYKYEEKRKSKRRPKKVHQHNMKRKVVRRKRFNIPKLECASVQAGSRSSMLSPLCVSKNISHTKISNNTDQYSVSPEMIVEALKDLTMWRQAVDTEAILNFLIRKFPVNPNRDKLLEDLKEKLRIAAIAEIIFQTPQGTWQLNHTLQKKKLSQTHVSIFWKAYGDTLRPVTKKNDTVNQPPKPDEQNQGSDGSGVFEEKYI